MLSTDAPRRRSTTESGSIAIEEVWRRYQQTPGTDLRNRLLEHYLFLVHHHARQIRATLPAAIELDDLVEAGVFGLMDAINAFDLARGVKFETFAALRIRGAIYDELRATDWLPRLVRSRVSSLQKTEEQLSKRLGRMPTDEEIADHLQWSRKEIHRARRETTQSELTSLSVDMKSDDSEKLVRRGDIVEDIRQASPDATAARHDLKNTIMKGLSRAERLVLVLYYYEHMTMREIGAALSLSESRVSQMHTSIIARLKSTMRDRESELTSLIETAVT